MDTFRKWWNKPKADDKSILARFYYADRALTAVASELDSFDGRAEPERCSRLVGRLRQGQDQVLAITNIIMDELLGDDRAPRAFRAKFPEEVLQESLAGQLWFGAECLAAGSSIMNREAESAAMRPLAKAVTKSLDHVRNLLREQCLRNKTPNSLTLNLDLNDAVTETLCESLKIFDRLFAEFEFLYVSAMVQVKSKQEHEMQELICVLFSETLQRALRIDLLEQEQVDYFDPALMFSIPRLAIVAGLVIYPKGPLNMSMPADQLSEMFRPFRTLLIKIRDLLFTLNYNELNQLEKLLCTNEDIHIIQSKSVEVENVPIRKTDDVDKNDDADAEDEDDKQTNEPNSASSSNSNLSQGSINSNSTNSSVSNSGTSNSSSANGSDHEEQENVINTIYISSSSSTEYFDINQDQTIESTNSPRVNLWTNTVGTNDGSPLTDEDTEKEDVHFVNADCASGYLIPNTNFGNLLQTTDTPLTDSFISSDDEYTQIFDRTLTNDDAPTSTSRLDDAASITALISDVTLRSLQEVDAVVTIPGLDIGRNILNTDNTDSGVGTAENTSLDRTPDSETSNLLITTNENNHVTVVQTVEPTIVPVNQSQQRNNHRAHHHHHHHHHYYPNNNGTNGNSNANNNRYQQREKCDKKSCSRKNQQQTYSNYHSNNGNVSVSTNALSGSGRRRSLRNRSSRSSTHDDKVSIAAASSMFSDSESQDISVALRASGRLKFKSTENLLHRLFVCIAGVADQLQTNFASDLRQILRSVFLMNTTPTPVEEELKITEKSKDTTSDLFEFRASENDVIHGNDGGSNHSIYSAEEANPETDSVFESMNGQSTSTPSDRQERSTSLETEIRITTNRMNIERSRSLGDDSLSNNSHPVSVVVTTSNDYLTKEPRNNMRTSRSEENNANDNNDTLASTTTTTIILTTEVQQRNSSNQNQIIQNRSQQILPEAPPRWIPDEEAAQCMACAQTFTTFRRRHHCRNCGGVFCGVCSNSQAPLPKFGLNKAVRVCRNCYILSVTNTNSNSNTPSHNSGLTS